MQSLIEKFRNKLNNKEFVYGVFMKTSDPMLVEILGVAGYDYAILDTEHGPTDIENQQNNIRACEARGVLPIVRVPCIDENVIGKALDVGACGIQVSQVRTADDVRKIIDCAKFYPIGSRGVCRFVRAADYSALNRNEYFVKANKALIILQLEGIEAIDNLEEILAVDGYDILFIGPYDLSQSLGVPGDISNPKVLSAMIDIVERAKAKGKIVGTFTDDIELVEKWKNLGVQYISHSTDSGIFYEAARDVLNRISSCGVNKRLAKILDCTLRDGGYVNGWKFGQKNIKTILKSLIDSSVDFIECGYVTEEEVNQAGFTKFNSIEQVNKYLPKKSISNFAVMINYGSYNSDKLPVYCGYGINIIRVAFHKKNLVSALEFCKAIKEKGYRVFVQPMLTSSYSDTEFTYLIKECNVLNPEAVYIVDSFGSMQKGELLHYFKMLERGLNNNIYIGFHGHNNMQLAFSNVIALMESANREVIIDSSIHGIGRGAGNLNTEILIEYLNTKFAGDYDLHPVLEADDKVLEKIYKFLPWGYSLPNYISAKHNVHPNYAKYLSEKNNLSVDDLNAIFDMLDNDKKLEFDKDYIEQIYTSYLESKDSGNDDFDKVKSILSGKKILMICPGKSLINHIDTITELAKDSIVISVNFIYDLVKSNFIFVGNIRRFDELDEKFYDKVIATTNIPTTNAFAKISYSSLLNDIEYVKDNSGLMLLKLLSECDVAEVNIFGMDGYSDDSRQNYVSDELTLKSSRDTVHGMNLGIKIFFEKELKIKLVKY